MPMVDGDLVDDEVKNRLGNMVFDNEVKDTLVQIGCC